MIIRSQAKMVRLMISLGGDKCGIPITDPYSSEGMFLARKLGVKPITIQKTAGKLKRAGVLQRTMKHHWKVINPNVECSDRGPGNYRNGKKIDPEAVKALYDKGMSITAIAKKLRISWNRAKSLIDPEYEKYWRQYYTDWRRRCRVQYQILSELGR